ncbi:spore protease YyaC [uncultured Metabacillus sp.]|uniref:spore protease YyaC n=1 Tax=Metabacillus sp. Hm71 TaxID=3450743 RepID=UPI00260A3410|nr:spore protease YyaC [uncultured Metabacillus sp.]
MAALDENTGGVQFGQFDNGEDLHKSINKYIKAKTEDIFIVCIGTDRSTGDSLAPLIGTMLTEKGYKNVIGTLDEPVHAQNLDERLKEVPEGKIVVAIDAALGRLRNVGNIGFNKGSLSPGLGVGKELTPVGDYNIQGTVNISGYKEFLVLQCTRLSLVMKMAKEITYALENAFPLVSSKDNNKPVYSMR